MRTGTETEAVQMVKLGKAARLLDCAPREAPAILEALGVPIIKLSERRRVVPMALLWAAMAKKVREALREALKETP